MKKLKEIIDSLKLDRELKEELYLAFNPDEISSLTQEELEEEVVTYLFVQYGGEF